MPEPSRDFSSSVLLLSFSLLCLSLTAFPCGVESMVDLDPAQQVTSFDRDGLVDSLLLSSRGMASRALDREKMELNQDCSVFLAISFLVRELLTVLTSPTVLAASVRRTSSVQDQRMLFSCRTLPRKSRRVGGGRRPTPAPGHPVASGLVLQCKSRLNRNHQQQQQQQVEDDHLSLFRIQSLVDKNTLRELAAGPVCRHSSCSFFFCAFVFTCALFFFSFQTLCLTTCSLSSLHTHLITAPDWN